MRPDMPKIAVERPRYGHRDRYPRGHLRSQHGTELEGQPQKEALSWRRYGTKSFSDNLAPLYRFLRANVGRPWDGVWGDMCAHISFDNAVQKHILGHVFGVVVRHVELRGREPHCLERGWRHPRDTLLQSRGRWPTLYICPRSGILKQAKQAPCEAKPAADPHVVTVSETERLHRVRGIWYREHLTRGEAGELLVSEKRQLGTRALKRLGLREAAS